jgi:ribosomal protein L32
MARPQRVGHERRDERRAHGHPDDRLRATQADVARLRDPVDERGEAR